MSNLNYCGVKMAFKTLCRWNKKIILFTAREITVFIITLTLVIHASSLLVPQPYNLEGDGPRIYQSRLDDFWSSKHPEKRSKALNDLEIIHWNADWLTYDKANEFCHPRYDNTDILLIQECGEKDIVIPGYNLAFRLREGRGIAIYCKQSLEYAAYDIHKSFSSFGKENPFLVCGIRVGNIPIISVYVHPSTNTDQRNNFVHHLCSILEEEHQWAIAGDLNDWWCLFSNENESKSSAWEELTQMDGVMLLNDGRITRPRSNRALDVTFVRNCHSTYWDVLDLRNFGSDHLEITFNLTNESVVRHEVKSSTPSTIRNWKQIKNDIRRKLDKRRLITRGFEIIEWYTSTLQEAIRNNSYGMKNRKKKHKPWWCNELSVLKRKRNQARNDGEHSLYSDLNKQFKYAYRKAKRKYLKGQVIEIARDRNPFEAFYKILPQTKKRRSKHYEYRTGPLDMANRIAHNFARISKCPEDIEEIEDIANSLESLSEDHFTAITEREFLSVLNRTNSKSSPGPDGLKYLAWVKICEDKRIRSDIIDALNDILSTGTIPGIWKDSTIYPLPKDKNNFRPIALLSCIGKVLEKIVTQRLISHCPKRLSQFGCEKGLSTSMALSRLIHHSSVAAAEGKYFGIVTIDFTKAYDTVWRRRLLEKLVIQGAPTYLVRYIFNWLFYRKNRVRFNNVFSEEYDTDMGIPQGSPISVQLWKSYISDIPLNDKSHNAYMDDIIFWRSAKSAEELHTLMQADAKELTEWIDKNRLSVNETKTKFVSNIQDEDSCLRFPIKLAGRKYHPKSRLKYLGVEMFYDGVERYIRLDLHNVGADLVRRCSIMKRAKPFFPPRMMKYFGRSIILGKLSYYLPFIGTEDSTGLKPLVIGLNHALRLITGLFISTPIPVLHAASGIPPLEILIQESVARLCVKLKTKESILSQDYHDWNLRGENISTLGGVYEFDKIIERSMKLLPVQPMGLDIPMELENRHLEALYKCNWRILDSIKEFKSIYENGLSFMHSLRDFGTVIWSDGSWKSDKSIGSIGFLWTDDYNNILCRFGQTFQPIMSSFQAEKLALKSALKGGDVAQWLARRPQGRQVRSSIPALPQFFIC